jgi:hypothetical protein
VWGFADAVTIIESETLDNAAKKKRRSGHQTQWAAQFAVASELCKKGYEVALTMGNHPTADIMVYSPAGHAFVIDVKGQYKRNWWVVREKPEREDAFYVFAFVPDVGQNRFFVLTQAEVNAGIREEFDNARTRAIAKGRPTDKVGNFPCVAFQWAEPHEDRWDKLPA